jgi:hypothetical protein
MFKKLVFCAVAVLVPLSAMATNWTLYDGETMMCQSAAQAAAEKDAPVLATPYLYRKDARLLSDYDGTKVFNSKDGRVVMINVGRTTVTYFSRASACKEFRAIMASIAAKHHGVTNPNELK